jgi:hypothetical protein
MASLGQKFSATNHDTDKQGGDYEDLPAGIYQFEIEATEIVETGPEDNRTGSGMKYTASVLAPSEMEGRKFFGFINLENKNAQAQEIGQKELACMCRALEIEEVEDTEELHFKAYTVKLGLGKPSKKKNPDGSPLYPARMEVKRYFYPDEGNIPTPEVTDVVPANDNKPAPSNPSSARSTGNGGSAASKPAGSRPWGKK